MMQSVRNAMAKNRNAFIMVLVFCCPAWCMDSDRPDLRYRYQAGEIRTFTQTINITIKEPSATKEATARFTYTEQVQRVLPSGADLQVTISGVELTDHFSIDRLPILSLEDEPFTLTVNGSGKVSEFKLSEATEKKLANRMELLTSEIKSLYFTLPGGITNPRQTWTDQNVFTFEYQNDRHMDQVVDLNYQLKDVKIVKGKDCHAIDIGGSYVGTLNQGLEGYFEGKMTGQLFFDPKSGIEIQSAMSYVTHFTVNLPEGVYKYAVSVEMKREYIESDLVR